MKRKVVVSLLLASMTAGIFSTQTFAEEVGVGEGETVTIWECNWGGETYQAALEKLAEEATAENIDGKGYKVEVSMVSWDNYNETYMTAVTAGTAPDIAWEASTGPMQYALMGEALDLTPIKEAWEEEGSILAEEIPQAAWDFESYNGEIIGLPVAVDGRGIVYRKDLFEAAGITELPATFDEFKKVCLALVESGVEAFGFTGSTEASLTGVERMFHLQNGTGLVDENDEPLVLSEKNQYTYNFLKELFDEGCIPAGILGYSQTDVQRMFLDGELAMIVSSMPTWVPEEQLDVVGVLTPFFGRGAEEHLTGAGYQAYHAFNQSGHPEATLAVLKWWIEHNDLLWTEGHNATVSIRPSQLELTTANDMLREFASTWLVGDTVVPASIWPRTTLPPYATTFESVQIDSRILSAIFTGADVMEASEATAEEIKEIVADYE